MDFSTLKPNEWVAMFCGVMALIISAYALRVNVLTNRRIENDRKSNLRVILSRVQKIDSQFFDLMVSITNVGMNTPEINLIVFENSKGEVFTTGPSATLELNLPIDIGAGKQITRLFDLYPLLAIAEHALSWKHEILRAVVVTSVGETFKSEPMGFEDYFEYLLARSEGK